MEIFLSLIQDKTQYHIGVSKMKNFCIIAVAVLLAGGGVLAVTAVSSSATQESINQSKNEKRKVSCSSCNGTGKAGSGVKGEGKYSCTRCKGTGWM